jgi:hypothetical protein
MVNLKFENLSKQCKEGMKLMKFAKTIKSKDAKRSLSAIT